MKYGVITACLNSEATIARAINSVLEQGILPHEYIFVDGGSTDETLNIIKGITASSKVRISGIDFKILRQRDKTGIYGALNIGVNSLTSDIVFILHSDDWYESNTAEVVLSIFDDHKEAGVVYSQGLYHYKKLQCRSLLRRNKPFFLFPVLHPFIHPACFVRREVYSKLGNFKEEYKVSADYDFNYRCYKSGIVFIKCEEYLVNVQMGGYASKNKRLARKENLRIQLEHGSLPWFSRLAYYLRKLFNR